MILGIMADGISYEQAEIPLRPGDMLVLFTDGVSEAMSRESQEFGEERLERILRGHAQLHAQEIIAAVHEHVLEFAAGAPQSDDITMMVLKVSG